MKRIFRLLMVATVGVAICVLVFSDSFVWAEDDPGSEGTSVARINSNEYESLAAAVAAASDGDTVILLDDIILDEPIAVDGKSLRITDDGKTRSVKGNENSVCPLFKVINEGTLTIDGTSAEKLKLYGGTTSATRTATTVYVDNSNLNIAGVTIDGGAMNGRGDVSEGAIMGVNESHITMSDGVVENTVMSDVTKQAGPFFISSGTVFDMTGGVIRNNISKADPDSTPLTAGAVLLYNWGRDDETAKMNMSGGTITGNKSRYGGGVFLTAKASLHMTGGNIDGNTAYRDGGGVCVAAVCGWGGDEVFKSSEFIMDGGSISDNKAANGAGIYVNSDAVYLNAGYIERNVTTKIRNNIYTGHGGGIYVSMVPRVLHINNAVITENTARPQSGPGGTSGIGGGLWACPSGSIDLEVTNGVAVYGNKAEDRDSAGDDLVNVYRESEKNKGSVTLSDRMLGGGKVAWYEDGEIADDVVGYARTSVPRFDPDDPGDPVTFHNELRSLAVKAVASESAIQRANEEAKLFIRYNVANHGGGIGTNGEISMQKYEYPEWRLEVCKEWKDIEPEDQKPVTVFLKIGNEILDSVELNPDNGWRGSFEGLPVPDTIKGEISVIEETTEYTVKYDRTVNEEARTISVIVSNSPLPPETTTEPTTEPTTISTYPVETTQPPAEDGTRYVKDETVVPTSTTAKDNPPTERSGKRSTDRSTETGDGMPLHLPLALLLTAIAVALMVIIRGRGRAE